MEGTNEWTEWRVRREGWEAVACCSMSPITLDFFLLLSNITLHVYWLLGSGEGVLFVFVGFILNPLVGIQLPGSSLNAGDVLHKNARFGNQSGSSCMTRQAWQRPPEAPAPGARRQPQTGDPEHRRLRRLDGLPTATRREWPLFS